MEEGFVYLLVTLVSVVLTLGGYLAYLSGRGRAARASLESAGQQPQDRA